MDEIILDLGEGFGSILVEQVSGSGVESGGLVQAGLGDDIRRFRANVRDLLRQPLAGLGKAFVDALPDLDTGADYQLEQFSVEFDIGLSVTVGADAGAVAKLTPNGAFKCTYTWKRKERENLLLDKD